MCITSPPEDGGANTALSGEATASGASLNVREAADPAVPPLVDPAALQDLGTQLDSPSAAKGFARDYAKMWDRRYSCLASALGRRDQAGSLEAVLSLRTSSEMVGGVQLAGLAAELEAAIRAGDMDRARSLLAEVAESGSDTVGELRKNYDLRDG